MVAIITNTAGCMASGTQRRDHITQESCAVAKKLHDATAAFSV